MNLEEKKIDEKVIYDGKIISLRLDTIKLPDGKQRKREVVCHNGAACILCLTNNDEIALIKQYRYSVGKEIWELPAGRINLGESPYTAAVRELSEETGFKVNSAQDMGYILPSPGYSSEIIYLYGARVGDKKSAHPDEGEFVENFQLPLNDAVEMVYSGEISDAKSALLILKVKKAVDEGKF